MKKLLLLLLILSLCLTGCDAVVSITNIDFFGESEDETEAPDNGTEPDSGTEPDVSGKPSGTPSVDPEDCEDHEDVNDDGYCDLCYEYVIVVVDLYAINDLHGKVNAGDSQPGIAGLTTYLKGVSNANTVLFSSGDMWQGSSESNLTHGALVTEWMNELGFVSMTLGNHEYDWGESYIESNAELAEFPLLAINVYDKDTNQLVDYATPSVVVSRGGVEIGIIGAIGDCYSSISGDVTGGFYFKVGSDLTTLVKAEADRLRAEGVDFIVFSIHDGYDESFTSDKYLSANAISYYDTALSEGYVDIVFEAHTHQSYVFYDKGDVHHLQGGGENKGISHAVVSINSANGNSDVTKTEIVKSSVYQSYSADPLIGDLLDKYSDDISSAYEVLGYNPKYRDDSEIEQLVAQLYYEYGVEKWGDQYDIVLGGGFIRTRNPYNLYAGEVTYSDIYSLLPFDNELVLCSIKGSDLKKKFINTTNSDYYIYGDYDASSIKDNQIYYIVTDTYTSTYAYNNLTEVARYGTAIYARDLVTAFIKEGRWF